MLHKNQSRKLLLVIADVVFCASAFWISIALWVLSGGQIPDAMRADLIPTLGLLLATQTLVYVFGGLYTVLWRFADLIEIVRMILLAVVSCLCSLALKMALQFVLPTALIVLCSSLSILAIILSRSFWRLWRSGRLRLRSQNGRTRTVMVVGAGEAGAYVVGRCLYSAEHDAKAVILVDDDPLKQNLRVHNVAVRGTSADIPSLVKAHGVQEIIIAIPSLRGENYTNLVALCSSTKVRVRVLSTPSKEDLEVHEPTPDERQLSLREINASDFLSRKEIVLDTQSISGYISGNTVMVTGGGGSIGSEICRQVMRFSPKELIIFDIYENNAYELLTELRRLYGRTCSIRVLIGSIRDKKRLADVMSAHRPQVVFHAAAHKHVSLMENSPAEAIKNNVNGTMNVLDVAAEHGVGRFVLLSTDKAVNPTNIMGASKRICEMLVQLYAKKTDMKCMAVRFGNVLGSHGSVIPLFEAQIRAGGPVTVTDPNITRFFMTIPEAAQLVLQAGGLANNGAIYVLDMGEPVRILDLAERMIRFFGYIPGTDIKILYTGLRKGEKLYEELMTDSERASMLGTVHEKILVAPPIDIDEARFLRQLTQLAHEAELGSSSVQANIAEIVETYQIRSQEEAEQVAV